MSHLFFADESGSDRKKLPYEVRGGILVPMEKAWDLIRLLDAAQERIFGATLRSFEVELKGDLLLRRKNFTFASQSGIPLSDSDRTRLTHEFLRKGYEEKQSAKSGRTLVHPRLRDEFRAFGAACLEMADEAFRACDACGTVLLAAAVDKFAPRPLADQWEDMLRKDYVYLFERLYYQMETQPRGAMAAMDNLSEERCIQGQRLNRVIARYFTRAHTGRLRSARILPEPLYARSDLTTLLGVADVAIYALNSVFRPAVEWSEPIREELRPYVDWIYRLRRRVEREDGTGMWTVFHMADLRGGASRA